MVDLVESAGSKVLSRGGWVLLLLLVAVVVTVDVFVGARV